MANQKELHDGLIILEKYRGNCNECAADYDIFYASGVKPEDMKAEDAKKLAELNWSWDEDEESWTRFID